VVNKMPPSGQGMYRPLGCKKGLMCVQKLISGQVFPSLILKIIIIGNRKSADTYKVGFL
jgi:hypothetical protein